MSNFALGSIAFSTTNWILADIRYWPYRELKVGVK